jgi:hypothetical protein
MFRNFRQAESAGREVFPGADSGPENRKKGVNEEKPLENGEIVLMFILSLLTDEPGRR